MCNHSSYYKRIIFFIIFFLLIFSVSNKSINQAYAAEDDLENELNERVDDILEDIDFSELEYELNTSFNLDVSFVSLVKDVLSGNYLTDYNSVFSYLKSLIFDYFRENLRFFISLFIIVVLFEIFKSFSIEKQKDVALSIKIIFSFLLATTILLFIKNFYLSIVDLVNSLFSFANLLFPILIGLLTLSGATSSASVFSSYSVFLLETGSVLIKFVLLPLSLSIALLSVFSSVFSRGNFSKLNSLFKLIFKYTIIIFFSIFGILSTASVVSATARDGVNVKLTKYAIKNYVPVLGGYISEGFDFLYTCSILIKNAVGYCAIFIILTKILMPILLIFVFSLMFKSLSVVTGFIGDGSFSNMFDDVSKSFSNFLSIVLGLFLIVFVFVFMIILSVGVV